MFERQYWATEWEFWKEHIFSSSLNGCCSNISNTIPIHKEELSKVRQSLRTLYAIDCVDARRSFTEFWSSFLLNSTFTTNVLSSIVAIENRTSFTELKEAGCCGVRKTGSVFVALILFFFFSLLISGQLFRERLFQPLDNGMNRVKISGSRSRSAWTSYYHRKAWKNDFWSKVPYCLRAAGDHRLCHRTFRSCWGERRNGRRRGIFEMLHLLVVGIHFSAAVDLVCWLWRLRSTKDFDNKATAAAD